jgi:hypothetical protein
MEMEKERGKIKSTLMLQRIVALRYNPYFEKEISKIRQIIQFPKRMEGTGLEHI